MKIINKYIKGDRYLWAFICILSIFSFLPIYSTSTNLILIHNEKTVFYYLFRHSIFLIIGFIILFITQYINYKYFGILASITMPIILLLLIFTIIQNKYTINNTARWLNIGVITFQTSTAASIILLIYCARHLAIYKNIKLKFIESFFRLKLPIILNICLIFPYNASTAIILFFLILSILFIGGYNIKYIIILIIIISFIASLFIFTGLNFYQNPSNRVYTWKNRLEEFFSYNNNSKENYQIKRAMIAIILGGAFGNGPGKSILKIFLPQSSSDFIYAIIVEEYGLIGGITILLIYILILFRILILVTKLKKYFASLLVLSVGLPIITQALINIGVTVHLLPITGQTLPIISAGGTSIWISFFSFGIILSVSKNINYINKNHSILFENKY